MHKSQAPLWSVELNSTATFLVRYIQIIPIINYFPMQTIHMKVISLIVIDFRNMKILFFFYIA